MTDRLRTLLTGRALLALLTFGGPIVLLFTKGASLVQAAQ